MDHGCNSISFFKAFLFKGATTTKWSNWADIGLRDIYFVCLFYFLNYGNDTARRKYCWSWRRQGQREEAWAYMKRLAVEEIGDTSFLVIKHKADSTWQDTGGLADLLEGLWRHFFLLFLFCQQSVKQGHPLRWRQGVCLITPVIK